MDTLVVWIPSGAIIGAIGTSFYNINICIYIYMYIRLVGDIGPNGNMGALCPMGTIGRTITKIINRTNSQKDYDQ